MRNGIQEYIFRIHQESVCKRFLKGICQEQRKISWMYTLLMGIFSQHMYVDGVLTISKGRMPVDIKAASINEFRFAHAQNTGR
jgi:hypothetical protein